MRIENAPPGQVNISKIVILADNHIHACIISNIFIHIQSVISRIRFGLFLADQLEVSKIPLLGFCFPISRYQDQKESGKHDFLRN